jgi:hypothetical protein
MKPKPYLYTIFLNGEDWSGGLFYAETEDEAIGHAMQQGERMKQYHRRMGKLTFDVKAYTGTPIDRRLNRS